MDGCRGGWLLAGRTEIRLFPTLDGLLSALDGQPVLIDMPIGLPDSTPRDLDTQARRFLPGRGSSVFPVPCRSAVYAADYEAACDENQRRFGKKISRQAWHICPRIREVDRAVTASVKIRSMLRESHPELAFSRLNGSPLSNGKKTPEGVAERLALLGRFLPDVEARYDQAISAYRRSEVARDDILDALVLLVAASVKCDILEDSQAEDERGIPIRMVMPRPPA